VTGSVGGDDLGVLADLGEVAHLANRGLLLVAEKVPHEQAGLAVADGNFEHGVLLGLVGPYVRAGRLRPRTVRDGARSWVTGSALADDDRNVVDPDDLVLVTDGVDGAHGALLGARCWLALSVSVSAFAESIRHSGEAQRPCRRSPVRGRAWGSSPSS